MDGQAVSSSVSAHQYQVRMTKLGHVVPQVFDEQLLFESPGTPLVFLSDLNIVMITTATVVVTVVVISTESAVQFQCTGVEGPCPGGFSIDGGEGEGFNLEGGSRRREGDQDPAVLGSYTLPQCLPLLC